MNERAYVYRCEQFAEQGCKVYATARNIEKMQGFTHAGIEKLTLDVKNDEDVKRVVEDVIDREGSIDILVNNAGVGCFGASSHLYQIESRKTTCEDIQYRPRPRNPT